jgi:NADP-dependent aldehyde dehydrogenase
VAAEGSYLAVTIDHPTSTAPGLARVNQPLGPVAVFGASNFPFAFGVLGNDFGSALAAGCPVVAKSHPATAAERSAGRIARALCSTPRLPTAAWRWWSVTTPASPSSGTGVAALAFTATGSWPRLWRIASQRRTVIRHMPKWGR